jgi:hypothetical protein
MNKFYYLRGVAPQEAREAVRGRNGRVSSEKASTRRGNDESRLAFGMNEPETSGVDPSVIDDFYIEAAFYANLGAYGEANPQLHPESAREVKPNNRGYILIYRTDSPLIIHKPNLRYGARWRTTSELPDKIDSSLICLFPANPMENPSEFLPFKSTDYSLSGRITLEQFDRLNSLVNN